ETAFPKLLRILVSYRGEVGYAPTVSEALSQVGIDATQVARERGEEDAPAVNGDADDAESDDAAGEERAGAAGGEREVDVAARDAAAERIADALDRLQAAQASGDYAAQGQALADLDRAARDYQRANGQ